MLSVNIYFDMWSIYILYAWSVFEKDFLLDFRHNY